MKRLLISISILILISPLAHADCIDWARTMTKYEIDSMPKWKKSVVIEPFENFTKQAGDDWLVNGIPHLLAEYLNTSDTISALSDPVAKYHPAAASPNYVIEGMYQRVEGVLRVFVKLNQGGALKKQLQVDIAYPRNKQFFESVGDAALAIMQIVGPVYNDKALAAAKTKTSSVEAYENYIRGVTSYYSFDPDQTDVARTWFEESKKADINYHDAYNGLIDTYVFMAMYNKQNKRAYAGWFEKAEGEIKNLARFAKRLPPPERPKRYVVKTRVDAAPLTNRFLIGNSYFVAGLAAAGNKQWADAAYQFNMALIQTPEDAITWLYLSQMLEKSGDRNKAVEAKRKAYELNKCWK